MLDITRNNLATTNEIKKKKNSKKFIENFSLTQTIQLSK
jgi:hypothetical protein